MLSTRYEPLLSNDHHFFKPVKEPRSFVETETLKQKMLLSQYENGIKWQKDQLEVIKKEWQAARLQDGINRHKFLSDDQRVIESTKKYKDLLASYQQSFDTLNKLEQEKAAVEANLRNLTTSSNSASRP